MRMQLKIILLLVTLIPTTGWTRSAWYEIEIIVFNYTSKAALQAEYWDKNPGQPEQKNVMFLVDPKAYQAAGGRQDTLLKLSENQLKLRDVKKIIQNSSEYEILFHESWRQLIHPREQAKTLYIQSEQTIPVVLNTASRSGTSQNRGKPVLEGTIKLSLSRFIHASIDLVYSARNPQFDPSAAMRLTESATSPLNNTQPNADVIAEKEPEFLQYRIQQRRRMTSKQLHYIDHPKVGILIEAWAYGAGGNEN